MKKRKIKKDISSHKSKSRTEQKRIGIDWQSGFTQDEVNKIEGEIYSHVADMMQNGYTSGELVGEEPDYRGWWEVDIQEDNNDAETKNEISKIIRNRNTSGYHPTFSFYANVWKYQKSGGIISWLNEKIF